MITYSPWKVSSKINGEKKEILLIKGTNASSSNESDLLLNFKQYRVKHVAAMEHMLPVGQAQRDER